MEQRDEAGVETTAIAELVSLAGKRVLDVGCGEGRPTSYAAARAATVYASDPNAERVAIARAAMHALRNIHSALVPNGLLVGTQPISAHPRVTAKGAKLGALDMREWIETIGAVDERVNETIVEGLYELTDQRELVVTSTFDDGPDCLEIASAWQGTRVSQPLTDRLTVMRDQVAVDQQVRFRLLRRKRASA